MNLINGVWLLSQALQVTKKNNCKKGNRTDEVSKRWLHKKTEEEILSALVSDSSPTPASSVPAVSMSFMGRLSTFPLLEFLNGSKSVSLFCNLDVLD